METDLLVTDLFVGPALVVDDEINNHGNSMEAVVEQIAAAGLPVFTSESLPGRESIIHWRGYSLIVLDWELYSVENLVDVPAALREENDARVSEFVGWLLEDLYCPVFIFSGNAPQSILGKLKARLPQFKETLETRVVVASKSAVTEDLFLRLNKWVDERVVIHVLKRWERKYEDAKADFFTDLEAASSVWPHFVWKASEKDKTDPHFDLSEVITRNILHRFGPVTFDPKVLAGPFASTNNHDALRRVIHQRAVVDRESLQDGILMPGDFFSDPAARDTGDELPDGVLIAVTPACDLVPRGVPPQDVKVTVLRAEIVPDHDLRNAGERKKVLARGQLGTESLIHVLRPDAHPYRVQFKYWDRMAAGDLAGHRRGRLLDPYITQLQQEFALYFHRQGLPALPTTYFYRAPVEAGGDSSGGGASAADALSAVAEASESAASVLVESSPDSAASLLNLSFASDESADALGGPDSLAEDVAASLREVASAASEVAHLLTADPSDEGEVLLVTPDPTSQE